MGESLCKSELKKKKKIGAELLPTKCITSMLEMAKKAIIQGLRANEGTRLEVNTLVVSSVFKVGVFNNI